MARPSNRSASTPNAPGAAKSPQRPGETPDRSTLPEHYFVQAPAPLGPPIRPAVQYLTAQELTNALPDPDEPAEPADFEQSSSSFEEQRKAYPWQTPPKRPEPWFDLGLGMSTEPPTLGIGEQRVDALSESTNEA